MYLAEVFEHRSSESGGELDSSHRLTDDGIVVDAGGVDNEVLL